MAKKRRTINFYLILFFLSVIILVAAIFTAIRFYQIEQLKQFFFIYKGYPIEFRRPISHSFKVKIIPNEEVLNVSTYTLASGVYKNLTIIIYEFDDNQATALQVAEIISKVKNVLNFENPFYDININIAKIRRNIEELNISEKEYYIFLKSYLISNETYIKVHKLNFVEISGKNLEEFDLAAIRFLISFLKNMLEIYR